MNHFLEKKLVSLKLSLTILISALLFSILVFYWLNPIPQPQSYHRFADQRSWLGMPNTWNVLSNSAIALPGLWGLFLLYYKKIQFNDSRERWLWMGVAIGLILTAIGSSYYHLRPDNSRLVWDRLPMTVVFMSLLAVIISERININLGLWFWPVLLIIGFYSVWVWYASELKGTSDLRFYIGIQVFTVLVAITALLMPSPYDRKWDLAIVILSYGWAVLFDFFDHQIYRITGDAISGHTLKHVTVGFTGAWLMWMIWQRKKEKWV